MGGVTPVLEVHDLTDDMAALLAPLADTRDYIEVTTSWGRWAVLRGDVMTDEEVADDDEPEHTDELDTLARAFELALYCGAHNLVPRTQPLGVRLSGLVIDAGIAAVRALARFAR
ncbi:MAG: hypothetical protein NVS3B16_27400 [Vulcanimicrobiaceae bacterium]